MDVTMLLCDAAQAVEGKLFVLGGGWSRVLANMPANMALAVVIGVPWDQANRKHRLQAVLVDDDGDPVVLLDRPVASEGMFEVGRPPGTKQGEALNAVVALSFQGLLLPAGGYVWELRVNGDLEARAPFRAT